MFNISELIHKELKPRKIRLVCVNMGIDLNCAKMTAIDELIISNFSFAAQLEKQLISERTRSALCIKKAYGIKDKPLNFQSMSVPIMYFKFPSCISTPYI
jgi:DNA invertase Pin-like site-specific DNA recombinase